MFSQGVRQFRPFLVAHPRKLLQSQDRHLRGANFTNNLLASMARRIEAVLQQQQQLGPRDERPETVPIFLVFPSTNPTQAV